MGMDCNVRVRVEGSVALSHDCPVFGGGAS